MLGPHWVLSYSVREIQLTALTLIHWFRRSQRKSFSPASLRRASMASSRMFRRLRCLPRDGLHKEPELFVPNIHSRQVVRVVAVQGSQAVEDGQPVGHILGQKVVLSLLEIFVVHVAQGQHLPGIAALGQDAAQPPGVPDGHGLLVDFPANGGPVRIIASRGQHDPDGCFRPEPAPAVMTSHRSRLGWAWSSSKITQLGL